MNRLIELLAEVDGNELQDHIEERENRAFYRGRVDGMKTANALNERGFFGGLMMGFFLWPLIAGIVCCGAGG